MKSAICLILLLVSILAFSGCDSSYEIVGLDRFDENICSMGTCDGLLPGDKEFLSAYAYEDGTYYYWTDGNYLHAKTFVRLQYPEDIYTRAKLHCENYYTFSEITYTYGDYVFSQARTYSMGEPLTSVQMLGCDDDSCALLFVGSFGYEIDKYYESGMITEAVLADFLSTEFGDRLKTD